MQTFLPYPDFADCAAVLDPRRLGKQRVEALQVLRGLTVPGYGWRHHPAVLMWRGHEEALVCYGLAICQAWTSGGRADTVASSLRRELAAARGVRQVREQALLAAAGDLPSWLGRPDLHLSHRSALLHKQPEYYRRWFGDLPALPYVWPRPPAEPPPVGPTSPVKKVRGQIEPFGAGDRTT
ncbi:MSMEG_6728 family protein [Micromonospora sp. LOL_023]|uniref:MSMEG_6728 family protein n=1 Tax=Micromonospora sp. LOL_023 TaxID=3345418 RepID=UPI003A878D5C